MKIAINDFISSRGTSGSSVAGRAVSGALESCDFELVNLSPSKYRRGRRMVNLALMLSWDLFGAARSARHENADVMVNFVNTGLGWNRRTINILHDTMVLDHPGYFDLGYRLYSKITFGVSVRHAKINVVPSEYTKARALARWPTARFRVIPWPAVRERASHPREAPGSLDIVVIASADKHKRLPLLIQVIRELRLQTGVDYRVKLIARDGNDIDALEQEIRVQAADTNSSWIEYIRQSVSDTELEDLIRNSFCVASSSIDEGFCLPLLEAALIGVPVVHTGRGAMSEVVPLSANRMAADNLEFDRNILLDQLLDLTDLNFWKNEATRSWLRSNGFGANDFADSWRKAIGEVANV